MDPAEARKLLPFKPCDQTSNQRLVYEQMTAPANREAFLQTARELKDEGADAIIARMVCSLWMPLYHGTPLMTTRAHYCVQRTLRTCPVASCCSLQPSPRTTLTRWSHTPAHTSVSSRRLASHEIVSALRYPAPAQLSTPARSFSKKAFELSALRSFLSLRPSQQAKLGVYRSPRTTIVGSIGIVLQ